MGFIEHDIDWSKIHIQILISGVSQRCDDDIGEVDDIGAGFCKKFPKSFPLLWSPTAIFVVDEPTQIPVDFCAWVLKHAMHMIYLM